MQPLANVTPLKPAARAGSIAVRNVGQIFQTATQDVEALRISMIFNLTGVILAEMYASRDGIGHQIATWGENFQMKQLLAGVVMIAVIAITFNELVRWVETRCSHWRT